MSPREFCIWFDGVLALSQAEDGSVSLTPIQYEKVKARLNRAATLSLREAGLEKARRASQAQQTTKKPGVRRTPPGGGRRLMC